VTSPSRFTAVMSDPQLPLLVVDDEDAIRLVFRRSLAREGWTVEEAATGAAALVLLRDARRDFAAVVLDHALPDRSGAELYALLRAERPALADRVIFSSGAMTAELEATGRPLLQKPFEIAALRALVRRVAAGG
jgi:DNA-binding response OmpR family regulator